MGVRTVGAPEIKGPVRIWDSSRHAHRANCADCGSNIFHGLKSKEEKTLGLGLFDDQEGWVMTRQIFTEEQPDHLGFGDKAVGFTGWGTLVALLTGRLPK